MWLLQDKLGEVRPNLLMLAMTLWTRKVAYTMCGLILWVNNELHVQRLSQPAASKSSVPEAGMVNMDEAQGKTCASG
jgi:hypothetical protein